MKLLLDTHVLIWWLEDPTQVAVHVREAVSRPENHVLVSAVSAWEIAIKRSIGKLNVPQDLEIVVPGSGFEWLPVTAKHAIATESLPPIHRDPFDRLLVAQAIVEEATIVTRDANMPKYAVPSILA
jgi:PIN domain nuclease of toxin-antitoxin system